VLELITRRISSIKIVVNLCGDVKIKASHKLKLGYLIGVDEVPVQIKKF
jgi:hypothetical protein